MSSKLYKFPKHCRITRRRDISNLFKFGHSFVQFPFKVIYCMAVATERLDHKVLFVVPKSNVSKAVRRNRIKRIAKEVYRLNQTKLVLNCQDSAYPKCSIFWIGYIYIGGISSIRYDILERAILRSLDQIQRICQRTQ